jgi:hypothetical protein
LSFVPAALQQNPVSFVSQLDSGGTVRHGRIAVLTIAAWSVAACGSDGAPVEGFRRERLPAIVSVGGQDVAVSMPDTVRVGAPLSLKIVSFGSSGCASVGETDVTIRGAAANVHPYRYELVGAGCSAIVLGLEHVVTLQFADTGTATIRIFGEALGTQAPTTLTRTVRVIGHY